MSKAPAQIPLDRGMPDLLSPILQWAKAQQANRPTFCWPNNPMQLGSSCLEGGQFLSIQSVKEPEIGLIFKVGFIGT